MKKYAVNSMMMSKMCMMFVMCMFCHEENGRSLSKTV